MNDKVEGTYTSVNGKALRFGKYDYECYIVLKIGASRIKIVVVVRYCKLRYCQ